MIQTSPDNMRCQGFGRGARRWVAALACGQIVSACSTVSFTQLTPSLQQKAGAPNGAVYYLPKPYLLVAQLPQKATATVSRAPDPKPPANAGSSRIGRVSDFNDDFGGADDPSKDDSALPTAGASSDFSFGGTSEGYLLKVVYLPDLSKPMSMSVRAGLGTASLKPTLVNGWALTGFDASADSKTADILASVAQVIGAYKTPGAKGGGGGADASAPDRAAQILRPGLYEFHYDQSGRLVALCPVSYFDETGAMDVPKSALCVS
ncbi:MAG: hypothetical protein ABIR25_05770 [Sphingomicrobium sp.]